VTASDNAPNIDSGVGLLRELALDLRWSWNHATDEIWSELEPELWSRTHNPWMVLQAASPQRLTLMLANSEFRGTVERLANKAARRRNLRRGFSYRTRIPV
jgi:glycogen phosphorylase